jgi:hypothetical protein
MPFVIAPHSVCVHPARVSSARCPGCMHPLSARTVASMCDPPRSHPCCVLHLHTCAYGATHMRALTHIYLSAAIPGLGTKGCVQVIVHRRLASQSLCCEKLGASAPLLHASVQPTLAAGLQVKPGSELRRHPRLFKASESPASTVAVTQAQAGRAAAAAGPYLQSVMDSCMQASAASQSCTALWLQVQCCTHSSVQH